MKVGFVGVGGIAPFHLQAFQLAGAEVVAVCSQGDSAQIFAQKHQIPSYCCDVREFAQIPMDAVCVLTQPSSYVEVLSALKSRNLPTLLEKPIAYNVEQAESLRQWLPEKTFVGLNRRFYGNIQAAKALIQDSKEMFVELFVPERAKDIRPKDEYTRNHWHMMNGIHGVDLLNYLVGMPEQFFAREGWGQLDFSTLPRFQTALYKTNRGHRVSFMTNYDSTGGWRIRLFSEQREIKIEPIEKTAVKTMLGEEVLPTTQEDQMAKPGFLNQARCFLEGARTQPSKDWVSYDDALSSMKVVEALFKSL